MTEMQRLEAELDKARMLRDAYVNPNNRSMADGVWSFIGGCGCITLPVAVIAAFVATVWIPSRIIAIAVAALAFVMMMSGVQHTDKREQQKKLNRLNAEIDSINRRIHDLAHVDIDARIELMKSRSADLHLPRTPVDEADFIGMSGDWMQAWAIGGVRIAGLGEPDGINLVSDTHVATVRMYVRLAEWVEAGEVQTLAGAAAAMGRPGIFFTWTHGYSPEAISFAEATAIALFSFNPATQEFDPVNTVARTLAYGTA